MQAFTESRRPSERTEQFLRDYVAQRRRLSGERLPAPRQIATELGVSEGTVRGVIRKWLKEGRLHSRQGSGIFISEAPVNEQVLRIGSNVRNRQSLERHPAHWGDLIHINILEAILGLGPGKSFASLYAAGEDVDALTSEEVIERCRHVDGMILHLPDPHCEALAAFCQQHGKPYVSLDAMGDDMVSNYVSLTHFTSFYRISRALRESGRRRFAILINPELERSAAIRQRLAGVINGIGPALGEGVELRVITCPGFQMEDGAAAVTQLWGKGAFEPDAILAAGDDLAIGAMRALAKQGVAVPQQVAVIAGAGFHPLLEEYRLTTLVHPLQEFGRHLVDALVQMLENGTVECPARLLPVGLRCGATTTEEESRRLTELFAGREQGISD